MDLASLLISAAAAAAATQQYPKGTLYVVATPIGNLADLSLRAIHTLSLMDSVACEDTRVSAGLLRHLGLHKPLLSVHMHNEAEAAERVIERLAEGQRVAFVSDAGTPGVSDPGARLVERVQVAGFRTVPLPGPSAVSTALSVAGDWRGGQSYTFAGFVPASGRAREAAIAELLQGSHTTVCFEAPHRIAALLTALTAAGERRITVCRELSKQFEEIHTGAAATLPAWLAADAQRQRGEFVLVLHARVADPDADIRAALPLLQALLPRMPLKQAVALVAEHTRCARNVIYTHALDIKARTAPDSSLESDA